MGKSARGGKLKVCVVTSEILGPVKNGGIGTATSALIDILVDGGHQVTVLYTLVRRGQPDCEEHTWGHWVDSLAGRGIDLTYIEHDGDYADWLTKSWLVKQYLGSHVFDVVYFNEHHGSAYYTLAAKRAGLSPFVDRVHCVITHGAIEWVMNTNDQRLTVAADLQMIGVERRSAEWADVVIGPSQYLLREYLSYGWALPRNTYQQPYPFPLGVKARGRGRTPVDELVFFGRLETRKGLWLFCEALDRMGDSLRGREVTFMGRPVNASGVQTPILILARAEKWPCKVNLLLDYSQDQALGYLSKPGRVAVMPSLADNSPCVVYECMQQQIPFIATSGSGADELVHPDCWPSTMCAPNAGDLGDRLSEVLAKGAAPAWPRFEAAENLASWKAWHQLLADRSARHDLLSDSTSEDPGSVRLGTATFIYVDDGAVTLGTLMDRLQRQMELFASFGHFALLSSRDEPLRGMIEGALEARASQLGCDFTYVAPSSLRRFLQAAKKNSKSLFVTDICDELTTAFVIQSRDMIATGMSQAVSCAAASRRSDSDEAIIEQLPAGDLPAAGGLGMRITSSAWAVSGVAIGTQARSADFIDPTTGELTPAQDIGQLVFHRMINADMPVRLIPEVGTVRTSPTLRPRHERHWYRSAVLHAEALGLKPYVFKDAAAWLSASAFGFREAHSPERSATTDLLPAGHPLRELAHTGFTPDGLAHLAAALGRVDQAVQISTAADIGVRVEELLAEAVRAVRNRPAIDLKALLSGETHLETASDIVKALRASTANLGMERATEGLVMHLQEAGLGEGTATFFDIALHGHEAFSLGFTVLAGACTMRATIIDQSTGAMLGKAAASGVSGAEERSLQIPLHGIHGLFCLIVEIAAPAGSSPFFVFNRLQFA
ncbi:glycosyltransferase [Aestuariivirga sp.]|uniref:glycosyltransferase n=1 Tax=Aestuariivirga sp. TaxID=2650926 RepID=UPI0035B2A0B3